MIVVGIDPGKGGALSAIREDGVVMLLRDTPLLRVGKRQEYDLAGMADLLRYVKGYDTGALVAIERASVRPGEGVLGALSFGEGSGIWLGIVAALQLRLERLTPQRWGAAMGLPKGLKGKERKAASRMRARELFPAQAAQLELVKAHGRSDALLICEFARRTFAAESRQVTDSEEPTK